MAARQVQKHLGLPRGEVVGGRQLLDPPAVGIARHGSPAVNEGKDAPEASEVQEFTTTAWGATYPWAPEPPAIDPADVEEELDVDVAVVGLGVAGVAAFRAASEQGVKVAAVEKAAEPSVRSSQYCHINGTRTEALGLAEVDEDEIIKAEWNKSCQFANHAIIRNFVRNESDVIDWWIDGDPECHIPEPGEQGGRFGDPNAPHTPSTAGSTSPPTTPTSRRPPTPRASRSATTPAR